MIAYVLRRGAVALGTVLLALVLIFVAVRTLPGNPVLARFGQHAVQADIAREMARQGWDRPLHVQLVDYLRTFATTGELGESLFRPGERVTVGLRDKFPATLELTLAALAIALPLGIAAGIAAAVWRNRLPDYACMTGALLGVSVPVFFLGICLMTLFENMPTGRRLPPGLGFETTSGLVLIESLLRGRLDVFASAARHLCLPAIALSTIPAAVIARITRSSMLETLSADYVRTARAKESAQPRRVVLHHALPNASIPIANIAGLQAGLLLSGAVLTETVFDWPGLGRYMVIAVQNSDYNVVQGAMLLVATLFVAINFALDLLYAWLDPRVRLGAARHA